MDARQTSPQKKARSLPQSAPRNPYAEHRQPRNSPRALELQRTIGNRATCQVLADDRAGSEKTLKTPGPAPIAEHTVGRSVSVRAVIARHVPGTAAPLVGVGTSQSAKAAGGPDADAEEGVNQTEGVDPNAVTNALASASSDVPSAAEGETVSLGDMTVPEELVVADHDSVAGTITYSPTVTQSGTVDPFGATTWNRFSLTGITVTPSAGTFAVSFTIENPITFNVASPKTSIASENDGALTNANFARAASDLTPNMSVQGGKPPRTSFWAQDLTSRHEHFHADERSRLNGAGATQAQAWLNSQSAASVADVRSLIQQVPGRVTTASQAAVGTVDAKESRAYSDGAPSYKARADAITAKGALGPTAGGYP